MNKNTIIAGALFIIIAGTAVLIQPESRFAEEGSLKETIEVIDDNSWYVHLCSSTHCGRYFMTVDSVERQKAVVASFLQEFPENERWQKLAQEIDGDLAALKEAGVNSIK